MRLPERDKGRTKISSPLVHGSLGSNDSDPIDISGRSIPSSGTDPHSLHTDADTTSPISSFSRNYSARSVSGGSGMSSSYNRMSSFSRSVGSFVGSYEESILNGRMSQTPSKPLDFTASIGVLGRGQCKSSLKCPPHLTVPFPAYFYSETSPYVGQIDVEQAAQSHKRGYRIPAAGQLQIIIKNPNKAAVKLFLIPYNVSDMPALSKTFFRQKHYDEDKLRYAIHIQICCPAAGKYYIHKSQRVVFANRVPDGKENLRIIIQAPEQKYTPWVPEKTQKKTDQHQRPDAKEPMFIGGSLLDRDHDDPVAEQEDQSHEYFTDGPMLDGQTTPRPVQRGFAGSFTSVVQQSRQRSTFKASMLSDTNFVEESRSLSPDTEHKQISSGILAEKLKALALKS